MNEERWPTPFLPILITLPSGGHLLQKECKAMFFPTISMGLLQLTDSERYF